MGSCMSTAASDVAAASSSAALPRSGSNRQRKRGGKRSASFEEAKSDEALRRIPGRMFSNGASGVASLFTQQGRKGTNQDAMIVWENFCSRSDTIFCGVFDGHGPYGHMVARQVRDSLPLKLSSHLEVKVHNDGCKENRLSTAGSMNSEESASINMKEEARASVDFEEKEKHPEMFMVLKQSFLKVFKVMDKELRLHPNIDCFCSGTTAVTLVKQGQDLVIGNVGDSRAVLGTRDQDNCLTAVQLTVDLKPNLPREEERIRRCKGRVFALQDEPEVARLWLPDNDSPGLAMARAFGDFCLKDFGLISVPDISYRCITERDEFIVLATDGVWDVLSNKEVVDIVASAHVRSYAACSLVEAAVLSWRTKYPTSKIDDCAAVCLFLNSDESTSTSSTQEACTGWSNSMEVDNTTELMPSSLISLERFATFSSSGILPTDSMEVEGMARVDTLLTLPSKLVSGSPNTGTKRAPDSATGVDHKSSSVVFDRQFLEKVEAVRRSAREQRKSEEKIYQAIDYDAPIEPEQSTTGLGMKMGVGIAVAVFGLVFAFGDFIPSTSVQPSNDSAKVEKQLSEKEKATLKERLQQYEETLSNSPEDPTALEGAAVTLVDLGEYERASALLEKLTKERPNDIEAYRLLGEVKYELKDFERSASAYKSALSASEGMNFEVLRGLTNSLLAAKKPSEAVQVLLSFREKLNDGSTDASEILVNANKVEQKTEKVDPVQVELLLGKAYSDWGHISDAVAVYDQLISKYPNDFRGYLAKGIILKENGKVGDAERMFIQARFFAPEKAKALVDRYSR